MDTAFVRAVEEVMVLRPGVRVLLLSCIFAPLLAAQFRGNDRGPVDPGFTLGNITLMLRPTAAQQAALEQLLADQQNPASPEYHKWLTPEAYAERFGASTADLEKIRGWLEAQGFTIQYTARGRDFISFRGTAAQVQSAMRTEIHRFDAGGRSHFASARGVTLPPEIAPMVAGVLGLDDYHPRAPHKKVLPNYTAADGSHFLLPDDLSTIYDLMPMYSNGYTGAGQSIVIVGQSDIDTADIAAFRSAWGLPPTTIQMVPTGNYPGITGDEVEADLDLEWSGAMARSANLIYVYSDDVSYSTYYAIDNNLAPVISESFGLCEYLIAENRMGLYYFQSEAQKANSMGITWLASSGDTGAAGCDNDVPAATQGLAVSLPASVPEITAVGGTEFSEGAKAYWSANNGLYGGSALSYIPEIAWNDTVASEGAGGGIAASGGGMSAVYTKPAWQTGPGVPSDGARDVPDIALNAAIAHDSYVIVSEGSVFGVGGTSAAAPAFAGILAVLNDYLVRNGVQAKPGVGNINPKLYSMAAAGTGGSFHDVTSGDNIVPCVKATPNCSNGQFGYTAGPGYDMVTGLGSVDAYNLITAWGGIPVSATAMTLAANPGTILASGSTTLTATVKAVTGGGTPTGTISFTLGGNPIGSAALAGSGGTATASITIYGGQLLAQSTTAQAFYAGNPTFQGSNGAVTITLGAPAATSSVAISVTPDPVYQQAPDANGLTFSFTIQLTETAGVATTVTGFTFDGVNYSGSVGQFFGSTSLPAHGTLTSTLKAKNISVPSTVPISFTGRDASGSTWSQQISVPFLPQPTGN